MIAGDGDGWVVLPDGTRRWGRHGAAGLLLYTGDAAGSGHVLLQHRAWWSHQGGTWGVPGGALDSGETPEEAALREFGEEVAGELGRVAYSGVHRQEHGVWRYDTVLGRLAERRLFTPGSNESSAIQWVAFDRVERLRLLPAFRRVWPELRAALGLRVELEVEAAAVLDGSAADPAAVAVLRDDLARLAAAGVAAAELPAGLAPVALHRWYPRVRLVVPEAAAGVAAVPGVEVVAAGAAGDTGDGAVPTVRVAAGARARDGALVVPPGWLLGPRGLLRA
jgi:8-oxo-dGTP pyrophosphatase MutT (NUDIX family)